MSSNKTMKHWLHSHLLSVLFICICVCVCALKLCPTLCDLMNYSLPGSSVHGISRQEYWSGLPFPPLGIFLIQGWNQCLLHLLHWQVDSLPLHHLGNPIYLYRIRHKKTKAKTKVKRDSALMVDGTPLERV